MKEYQVPLFLPKDRKFRDWNRQVLQNAASLEEVKQAVAQLLGETIQRSNRDRDKIENNVGVLRGTETPNNWLKYTDFRTLDAAGAPKGWTISGAGGTISLQNGRTGGNTLNKAVRIAAGAGNAVKLTQSVEFFPGEVCGLAGWVKPTTGTGRINIVTTGAATNIDRPINFSASSYTTFRPFPTDQLRELWVKIPTDATGLTIELEVDASSTLDFCELQFGPGPVREPHLWTPGHDDGQSDGEYTPTGTGVLNITGVTPGVFQFMRVGSRVLAKGPVLVQPTGAGACTFRLSLPLPSNIGAVADASGQLNIAQGGATGIAGDVTGVVATDDVLCGYISPDGNQRTAQVSFMYKVI